MMGQPDLPRAVVTEPDGCFSHPARSGPIRLVCWLGLFGVWSSGMSRSPRHCDAILQYVDNAEGAQSTLQVVWGWQTARAALMATTQPG